MFLRNLNNLQKLNNVQKYQKLFQPAVNYNISLMKPFKGLPKLFRKKENKIENAYQKSLNIPDSEVNFSNILKFNKFQKNDTKFVASFVEIQKLRHLQKEFYKNVDQPENAYYYFKELNRQGKHQTVIKLYHEYKNIFLFINDGNNPENHIYIKKTYDQFSVAEEEVIKTGQNTQNLIPNVFKKKQRYERLKFFMIYAFFFMILVGMPTSISFEGEDDDNPSKSLDNNDEDSADSFLQKLKSFFGFDKSSSDSNDSQEPSSPSKDADSNKPKSPSSSNPANKQGNFINRFFNKGTDIQEEKNIKTRFNDVLGIDEFKEELLELVDYLKNPQKYQNAGAKLPKGILLVGPPGTGKTLLARALAGEANCTFFSKTGSEFDEMFVGVGASRVRELFKKARDKAPSIIFIDEIDSVAGTRRNTDPGHSRDTVNQILSEMDGFKQSDNIIVIGATNIESAIDPAIKRPGRFDKIIHVPLPDIRGRQQIFDYYLKGINYNKEILAKELARQTSGFSGADIQNMVNLSILNAIKNNRDSAEISDFDWSLDRIAMGIGRKNMLISDKDKLITAYHEGGHTITALLTEGATPIHKVTILPRGGALGFTSMIPETDKLNYTKRGMIAQIDVAMGGRAAEELFLGNDEITTGCSSDLNKATELAYAYLKQLGMNENITLLSVSDKIKTSDRYDYMVDLEVQKLLKESYDRVKKLLKQNEKGLKELATELIQNETLDANQVKEIVIQGKLKTKEQSFNLSSPKK